nr:ABC transporter ATP-binding protein [Rhizobium sp. ACO-34A]
MQFPKTSAGRKIPDLELIALHASYGQNHVVKGIDLKVHHGELIALLGPSGCGKSTILRLIAGLEQPTSGAIRVSEKDITSLPPHQRSMGIMFQDYALFPHMSVGKNVGYGLRMRGNDAQSVSRRVAEMLDLVGLADFHDRLPAALSGGQRQRVALARALAIGPSVLLLDEPFSALDRHLRLQMQAEVRRIQRATSVTTIFVTHDQEEALAMSDRIAVMSKGVISDIGEPQRIYNNPASRFALDFIGGVTRLPVQIEGVESGQTQCRLLSAQAAPILVDRTLEIEPVPGQKADLALRCEQIRLSAAPIPGFHAVSARIIDRVFVGTSTHFTLAVGETEITTIEPSGFGPELSSEDAYACWPEGAGWLV